MALVEKKLDSRIASRPLPKGSLSIWRHDFITSSRGEEQHRLTDTDLLFLCCSEQASSYDTRHQKTIDQLIAHIQKRKDFIGARWVADDDENDDGSHAAGKPVRFLDYACGTGLVSRVSSGPNIQLALDLGCAGACLGA